MKSGQKRNSSSSFELYGFLTNGSDPWIGYTPLIHSARGDETSCVTIEGESGVQSSRGTCVSLISWISSLRATKLNTEKKRGTKINR